MYCIAGRKFFIFLFIVLSSAKLEAQIKVIAGRVTDSHSDEPIPFASVQFLNSAVGKLTDSSGSFSIYTSEWPSDSIIVTCVGYQPFKIFISSGKDSLWFLIRMERGTFTEEARVKVSINKGLFLWRKIVENKSRNDKFRFDNFSYEVHNKLELDLKNINLEKLSKFKPLKPATTILSGNIDTSEGLPYLPAYLTEALSDYYYQKKPLKRREVIKAINTNGIKNESMQQFLGSMDQNVNFYNNFIPVMNKEFVSPASDNGDHYYNYTVLDTQVVNQNRYFHLVFTPKRRGENTFEGDCWVHAGTFAIQRMNLRLGKDANINFVETLSMIQEYQLLDDSTTWFLAKDKFVADITPLGKEKAGFIGRKTTTYRNIVVNDSSVTRELDKNRLFEEVHTLEGANQKEEEYWLAERHERLSKNETSIIRLMDTLTKDPSFIKFTNKIYFITAGYLKKGIFEFGPWFNAITASGWEGFRLRFDLGTTPQFSKKLWLHGYTAYGFRDKNVKWKAEAFFLPSKHPRTSIHFSFTDDLDFGQNYFGEVSADNVFALAIRKNNIPIKFIRIKEHRLSLYHQTKSGFSANLIGMQKSFEPLRNIPVKDSFRINGISNPLATFELTLKLRFAYLERFLESTFNRISIGSPYPIPELTITKGISGVLKSNYNYTRISASVSDFMKVPPYGTIEYLIYGGKTFGNLPYVFLDIAPGNELYYYNKYAYNLMNRFEYIHDRYLGINFEHNVGNGIFRLIPKLKFRQFWNVKLLWGSLSDENKRINFIRNHPFRTLDGKTYMELGTGVDNILKVLRVDLIWRVAPAPIPNETSKRFGIFGSFRLSF